MQLADDAPTEPSLAEPSLAEPDWPRAVRGPARTVWIAAAIAFGLGLAAAGWLGWISGADFGHVLGTSWSIRNPGVTASGIASHAPSSAENAQDALRDEMALAGRVAAMEQRLDRVDLRVAAAAGNADRAEALLVAFAVRRVVERGAPLGYLADQLKLRFGDAQPHAVATIIAGAKDLVPPGQLAARLEALAPQLSQTGQQSLWRRVTRELSEMFVVRRDRPVPSDADVRLDDARRALNEGRLDDAIADIRTVSGPEAASWAAAARRTRDVENALDLIDTTALLAPRQLRDGNGNFANSVFP